MTKKIFLIFTLLLTSVAGVWAWDGSGTSADPYLIQSSADWRQLADDVRGGNSYSGKVFRMTADIDAQGVSVGQQGKSFSGIFDGDGNTLTYNRGSVTSQHTEYVDDYCAPFSLLEGATIRHLKVTGTIYSSHKWAAGIASRIDGTTATNIVDCHVSSILQGNNALSADASFGGLVGVVEGTSPQAPEGGGPTIKNCSFTGSFQGTATCSGGMVGYTSMPVTFSHCLFDPERTAYADGCATYIRTPENIVCPMEDCYYTTAFGLSQGQPVFREVEVPEGCTYQMVSEANVRFNGVDYYTNGTQIVLTAPDDMNFGFWSAEGSCFVSDPWTKNGVHELRDVRRMPSFTIATKMPNAKQERTIEGTKYRYLSESDYQLYLSKEYCDQKGYYIDGDGWLVKTVDGTKVYVTAVTGWWGPDIPKDGAQIHNDLVGTFRDHTLLGIIAPHAFDNCWEIQTLYFKDTDANNYNAKTEFDFLIGDYAFANCPSLTEIKMMQYTTRGDNHWEALRPDQVGGKVAANVFSGSPQAKFSTDVSEYQNYLSSATWKEQQQRIAIYNHTSDDVSIKGCKYSYFRNTAGEPIKNSAEGHAQLMETLKYWNADYQQFTASSLFEQYSHVFHYTQIVGIDEKDLKDESGLLRIYNHQVANGDYSITIAINSLSGSKDLLVVEFYNANREFINREMKMVIRNGAFKGCDNLRELRMYKYVDTGSDEHWEELGPENVIPGNNIFGLDEGEELDTSGKVHKDFRILVSPDRYQDFLYDPNWQPYLRYIEPMYPPQTQMEDFVTESLIRMDFNPVNMHNEVTYVHNPAITHGYISSPGGILTTSQTVSQDVSWWTAPLIGAEVAQIALAAVGIPDIGKYLNPLIQMTTGDGWWAGFYTSTLEQLATLHTYYYQSVLAFGSMVDNDMISLRSLGSTLPSMSNSVTTAAMLSKSCWGGKDAYSPEKLRKGMRANLLSNIRQVGVVGGGWVITTPQKNLVYHTFIKSVLDDVVEANIYTGTDNSYGSKGLTRVSTIAKTAFHNKPYLEKIFFTEGEASSNESVPMLLTLPDSAFIGCNKLRELNLLMETKSNGTRALGPENFILAGDSVFAGLSPDKFHIVIDPTRKQDFLDNESWAPLQRFFVYEPAAPEVQHYEYGGGYAYAYDGTVQKVHKKDGHKIEHTVVVAPDNEFLKDHQGALKLCNDIGVYNNYQLDAVGASAFKGNQYLRVVNFTDLKGTGAFGDCYSDVDITLKDSCFANCRNLKNIDLFYIVTDGTNHIDPLTPEQVRIGRGVLNGTTARIKMMPQQVAWFEADPSWANYKDRFMPCVIQPGDDGIKAALKNMPYYDMAHTGYDPDLWTDYIDLARIAGHPGGFAWLNSKFRDVRDNIRSFAEFKYFESVGLDYVGKEWFRGCRKLTNIVLPSTIKTILDYAFASCSSLQEIELLAAVSEIGDCAFADCQDLRTVIVRSITPAKLTGKDQFQKNDGLRIYVPAAALNDYLTAWAEYKDYIVSDASNNTNKVVTVSKPNELAEKLGLSVEYSYSGLFYGDEPRYVHGPYAKYDSLTISGPLGNVDLAVIRYLAGCDAYTGGGKATDGRLRYLNLYDASIKKTNDGYNYFNDDLTFNGQRYSIISDNVLPAYLFKGCTALQTLILPRSLTAISGRVFEGCSALKRVAFTGSISDYDDWIHTDGLTDYTLEELAFITDTPATSSHNKPWQQPINNVYTKPSQLGDYMNQSNLLYQARNITAPFDEDVVMDVLAAKGEFFPTEYLQKTELGDLFIGNTDLKTFDDFYRFYKVVSLDNTFTNCSNLQSITLPQSLQRIGAGAFAGCKKLESIHISCDTVPQLEADAFSSLPGDFRIFVPRRACKLYRTKWAQYADHINPDNADLTNNALMTVTVTEPNTLAEALGLEKKIGYNLLFHNRSYLDGISGNYSKIRKLKVVGPISGIDFDVMRHLAGYCSWAHTRNYAGPLEYIDLYDAQIVETDGCVNGESSAFSGNKSELQGVDNNVLPYHAFLKAYNLKTLILPKTCKEASARALQECEGLESLVVGDDMEDFNWNALDDDVALTRMYFLSKKKTTISTQFPVWRWLCNNYNPTFDAFYVRPSLYKEYISDEDYTGKSWQRTNNISTGLFDDDTFCAFAAHAAATKDDLASVKSVGGWFNGHTGIDNLTCLSYTAIDSLDKATIAPLTRLMQIALPASLYKIEEGLFAGAPHLRYADFLLCDSTDIVAGLRNGGLQKLGINTQQTLAYVPATYGETDETNVITSSAGTSSVVGDLQSPTLRTKTFRMIDTLNYLVPYAFEAEKIENSRTLAASAIPYTFCVPYKMNVPDYARAYKLAERDGNSLVFTEVKGELEAMHPYLLKVVGNKRFRKMSTTLNTNIAQTIPASGGNTYGRQDDALGYSLRGTFDAIGNKDAADLGAYILQSDGDWHPVVSGLPADKPASILPFRAFLLPSAHNAVTRISMTLDDDTTGIDSIETIDEDGTRRYYDLNGREVDGSTKGIIIQNGKKVVIK